MVGKGRTTQTLDLDNISIAQSARITAAFTVTELTEEEAKRVNTEEKRVSSAFGGLSGGVANAADAALLKQIEGLKKTLEERDEEVAKY